MSAVAPAIMVEPYAIAVVYPNHFPAPFPRPAIAGEMSAKIKTGMKKFRKLLNSPLNVAKMRPSHSGAKRLTIMPRTIAMMILNNSERSEEHTSELQSRGHLVCRLLLD